MSVGEVDGTDVLLPVAGWPGFRWTYELRSAGSGGDVNLVLTAAFLVGPLLLGDGGVDIDVATLDGISAQLLDPRTDLALLSTLAASEGFGPQDWGVVAETDQLREPLQALVAAASEQLQALALDGGAALAPILTKSVSAPLPLAPLAGRSEDVIPVGVYLRLRRRSKDDPGIIGLPAPTSAISVVEPNLVSDDADPLASFAARCESALADYDGAGTVLKLAASAPADGSAATPELWAVRWSAKAGVFVERPDGATASAVKAPVGPSCFAPVPLSNHLLSGAVDVPVYGADLQRHEQTLSYSGISLASWATLCLQLVDELVGSKWIASDNSAAAAQLPRHRATLVEALVVGLSSPSPDQPAAVSGGLASARTWLREALVRSLAVATDLEAVVTVPVVSTRRLNSHGALAVRGLVEAAAGSAPDGSLPGYVAAEAQLSLVPAGQSLLSFGLSTGPSGGAPELPLRYRISHLQHRVDSGTTWLEFLVGGPGSALDVDLGLIRTHQPSQALPEPPILHGHEAMAQLGAHADTPVMDALGWKYVARLSASTDPRDQLWIDTSYGVPADIVGAVPSPSERAAEPADPAEPAAELFGALARLLSARQSLGAHVADFPDAVIAAKASPVLQAAVRATADLVREVATAWKARTWQPVLGLTPGPATATVAEGGHSQRFVLSFAEANGGESAASGTACATVRMFGLGSGAAPPRFPALSLGGASAVVPTAVQRATSNVAATGSWWQADYACHQPFSADATELAFTWADLEILAPQSATMTCRTVRNAEFGAPEFVFTSGTAGFGSPAEPCLVVPQIGPLPWLGSMFDSIWPVFEPIAASAPVVSRILTLHVDYEWPLNPLASDAGIASRLPVILVPQVEIRGGDDEAMRTFVTTLAAALSEWQSANLQRSNTGGSMLLNLEVSGNRTPHPLVTFERISVLMQ